MPRSLLLALPAALTLFSSVSMAGASQSRASFPLRPIAFAGGDAMILELVASDFEALRERKQIVLDQVPLPDADEISLSLRRMQPVKDGGLLVVDGEPRPLSSVAQHVQLWTGEVLGEAGSFAFLSLSPFGTRGVIRKGGNLYHLSATEDGNAMIRSGASPQSAELAGLLAGSSGMVQAGCGSADLAQPFMPDPGALSMAPPASGSPPGVAFSGAPLKQANIAIETDYQFYQKFSDADEAAAYVVTLLGAASAFYEAQCGAVFSLPYVGIHTSSNDGWSSPDGGHDTADMLYEFRGAWAGGNGPVSADLYHFLSGASLGGGIAYINVLCNQWYGFGVSANLNGNLTLPVTGPAPWDLVVVSHELGHNFSSPHTHSFCPPLDQCAPSGYFGSCQSSQVCIPNGTIMSYCHLCAGGLSNIDLEFHSQVATTISTAVANSCLLPAYPLTEICVDQPLGIHQEVDPLEATEVITSLALGNCGESDESIDWSASLSPSAPWLALGATSGTVGVTPFPLSLTFDATGLEYGLHSTMLHLQNTANPTDLLDVPITLLVLAPPFVAGDQLSGVVVSGDDVDQASFEGLKKAKLKLVIDHRLGTTPLRVCLLDQAAQVVCEWLVNAGSMVNKKKKLRATGSYTLQVMGVAAAAGSFEIGTGFKQPENAQARVLKKVKPVQDTNYADVTLVALEGASLEVVVKPRGTLAGPLTLALFDPEDETIDLSGHVSGDGLSFTGLSLNATGAYRLRITGFSANSEKAKVILRPTQPEGTDTIVID